MEQSITVEDLDKLVEEIFVAKDKYEEIGRHKAEAYNEFVALKAKAVTYLRELERRNYKTDKGLITISQKYRVKLPVSPESKGQLFDYLKEKGVFEKYATVNSNSLNALHKAEREAAEERGEGMTWSMPGIDDPTLFEDLTTKKG
jgi:hypothetical protein